MKPFGCSQVRAFESGMLNYIVECILQSFVSLCVHRSRDCKEFWGLGGPTAKLHDKLSIMDSDVRLYFVMIPTLSNIAENLAQGVFREVQ